MDLSREQLEAFRDAGADFQSARAETEARIARAAGEEAARLESPYRELAAALAAGAPEDEALAAWAGQIEAAREGLEDPRALKGRLADRSLSLAHDLLGALSSSQRREVVNALFLLREQVGVGVAPDAWREIFGDPWPAGDFATLRRGASPADQGQMDLGGLWTLEAGAIDPSPAVIGLKLQAVLALAVAHPDLGPACEVMLGARAPMALGVASGEAAPDGEGSEGASPAAAAPGGAGLEGDP